MSYNLTQQLNHINENNWDDDICADVAQGQFIAVTAMEFSGDQRNIRVQIMQLDQAPGGRTCTNSGLYIRQQGENSVKATLYDLNGQEVDSNVTNYP